MSATEQHENTGKSLELREKSRYQASARLSVAPMMDWTVNSKLMLKFSNLRSSGVAVLHCCYYFGVVRSVGV